MICDENATLELKVPHNLCCIQFPQTKCLTNISGEDRQVLQGPLGGAPEPKQGGRGRLRSLLRAEKDRAMKKKSTFLQYFLACIFVHIYTQSSRTRKRKGHIAKKYVPYTLIFSPHSQAVGSIIEH